MWSCEYFFYPVAMQVADLCVFYRQRVTVAACMGSMANLPSFPTYVYAFSKGGFVYAPHLRCVHIGWVASSHYEGSYTQVANLWSMENWQEVLSHAVAPRLDGSGARKNYFPECSPTCSVFGGWHCECAHTRLEFCGRYWKYAFSAL